MIGVDVPKYITLTTYTYKNTTDKQKPTNQTTKTLLYTLAPIILYTISLFSGQADAKNINPLLHFFSLFSESCPKMTRPDDQQTPLTVLPSFPHSLAQNWRFCRLRLEAKTPPLLSPSCTHPFFPFFLADTPCCIL